MYAGHFAIGMALRARTPKLPALPILIGVAVLDILNGIFIIAGWDRVTPNPRRGPYLFFDLSFIDWDHSLLMAALWSLVWGALFLRDKRLALIATLAAFSHFVADWPMHNNDLALYPHAREHLGYGLWGRLGTASWLVEGLFVLLLLVYASRAQAKRGVSILWPSVMIAALFVSLSPWLSPMKLVATFPEPATHLVHGALITIGFVVPGALLTWLVTRAEKRRSSVAEGRVSEYSRDDRGRRPPHHE
jgi:hypothetical protein